MTVIFCLAPSSKFLFDITALKVRIPPTLEEPADDGVCAHWQDVSFD
jgi:hypothetical protein